MTNVCVLDKPVFDVSAAALGTFSLFLNVTRVIVFFLAKPYFRKVRIDPGIMLFFAEETTIGK